MRRFLPVLVFISILLPVKISSAENWQRIGPYFAITRQLVPVPGDARMWLLISGSKLYRSIDSATSWRFTGIANAQQAIVHPVTSRILVFTRYQKKTRIWRSDNLGFNFQKVYEGPLLFGKVSFDPRSHDNLAAHTGSEYSYESLSISLNGAGVWQDITQKLIAGLLDVYKGCSVLDSGNLNDVAISPFESRIYVSAMLRGGTNCHTTYVLMGGNQLGQKWEIEQESPTASYWTFTADSYFADRIFVDGPRGLHEITPTGLQTLSSLTLYNVESVPGDRQRLFGFIVVRTINFVESTDGGRTWHNHPPIFQKEFSVFKSMRNPQGGFLIATPAGLYRRGPDLRWKFTNDGFRESNVQKVASSGNSVYALISDSFLRRSTDAGRSWSKSLHLREGEGNIVFHPTHKNVVYLFSQDRIFISLQSGLRPRKLPLDIGAYRILIDPLHRQLMFLVRRFTIYKSTDGGKTAALANAGLQPDESDMADIAPVGSGDHYLAVDGWGVVYLTIDGARRWQIFSRLPKHTGGGGDPKGDWNLHPADLIGKHFYAIDLELRESIDGGKTWKPAKPQFPDTPRIEDFTEMTDPLVRPFFVATDQGVFIAK